MRVPVFVLSLLIIFLVLPLLTVGYLPGSPLARADESPYPPGQSIQQIEGLKTVLVLPNEITAEEPASLLVILHGAGGTATGMAGSFSTWAKEGYVVCAPKSTTSTWEPSDLKCVFRIAAHMKEVLPIDPRKVHVVGYSNGGWNLHPLAFDDDLHPCSATWIAAGFRGGHVPKWAKKELGAIALAGGEDPNLSAARATVPALRDKVRNVEVQVEPGLGHEFPRTLMPYLKWWMGVQEGRLTPGDDLGFDWTEDLDAALASQEGVKKGGVLVWAFAAEDVENPLAKDLQHVVFFDPEIRFLGRQIPCVKLDLATHAEVIAGLGIQTTPALVVLDRKGKVKKRFEDKFKAKKIARTLRGVAPKRTMPK